MKILYAIQATGNGHVSRAREIVPHLLNHGEVDLLLSGRQADVQLPYMITYRKKGIGFTFGKRGDVDLIDTAINLRPFNFIKDISRFPVDKYDLIINDFEPVTAWACKLKNKKCVALSHQSSYLSLSTPRPEKKDLFAEWIFKNYAPCNAYYGFHFKSYADNIYTPVIRSEIRNLEVANKGHITVYLPAYADEILIPHLLKIHDIKWEVFSKHSKMSYINKNVKVQPISNSEFIWSLASGNGLVTAGGFESPAEAIHLKKKILVVPMSNQYEQICNAEAMKTIGITVVKHIDRNFEGRLRSWLHFGKAPDISYPDITEKIIENLVMLHSPDPVSPMFI